MMLKRMGVMNVTPNSFSDGGEFYTPQAISQRIQFFNKFGSIDIGCESTAPKNASLPWETEWERWQMVLPHLKNLKCVISADTYHPETIFELVRFWKDHKLHNKLIWNDVSGKYDEHVREFLKSGHDYVFCHNLAPNRELTGRHMEYVRPEIDLYEYFHLHRHPQVIFDPCLGFSKSYEQNWEILATFGEIQKKLQHDRWLIGFSRKSFLRKKYSVDDREELDRLHALELEQVIKTAMGELWVRTHRPELIQDPRFSSDKHS
jgi:dihydropteroate synthase